MYRANLNININPKNISKRKSHYFDPMANILIENFHLTPLKVAFLTFVIAAGVALLTAWISDTLWSKNGQSGLLETGIPWIALLILNPVILGYYLYSFRSINSVIQDLEASDIVETNQAEVDRVLRRFYYRKRRILIALGSAISFSCFVFITRPGLEKSWSASGLLPNIATTIATFIIAYAGSMLVLNLISNIRILYLIFREKNLNINPFHPDRCGGLCALSNYSLKTAYLIAILGVWVGIVEYQFIRQGAGQAYWYAHLLIPFYFAISITCFFGPLLAAHNGMKKVKEDFLHQIAQQFQIDYSEIHGILDKDVEALQKGTEKIQQLRTLYTITDAFPVWPLDLSTLRRYLFTASTPFIPLLIGLSESLIGALLKQWKIEFF